MSVHTNSVRKEIADTLYRRNLQIVDDKLWYEGLYREYNWLFTQYLYWFHDYERYTDKQMFALYRRIARLEITLFHNVKERKI